MIDEVSETQPASGPDIVFAGFWIRVLAYLIDFLVLLILLMFSMFTKSVGVYLLLLVPLVAYKPLTEGLLGGTAGKLALGLKVVNQEGERIGVVGGFIRSGLFILPVIPNTMMQVRMLQQGISPMDQQAMEAFQAANQMLFTASYLFSLVAIGSCIYVAFNAQKQGLHDKLAATWVVRQKEA